MLGGSPEGIEKTKCQMQSLQQFGKNNLISKKRNS
jgi:hypothetical protein